MSALKQRIFPLTLIIGAFALVLASCTTTRNENDRPTGQNQKKVTCESHDQARKTCEADLRGYRIVDVNEISDADCDIGRNYGYNNRGVWVDDGCRAEFVFNRTGRRSN